MHHMTQSHNCCLATHVCQQRQCTSACMLTSVLSHSALQRQGAELAHRDKNNTALHSYGTCTAESSACALAETLAQQHCSGSSTAKPPAALMLLHTPTLPSAWIHTLSLNAAAGCAALAAPADVKKAAQWSVTSPSSRRCNCSSSQHTLSPVIAAAATDYTVEAAET